MRCSRLSWLEPGPPAVCRRARPHLRGRVSLARLRSLPGECGEALGDLGRVGGLDVDEHDNRQPGGWTDLAEGGEPVDLTRVVVHQGVTGGASGLDAVTVLLLEQGVRDCD